MKQNRSGNASTLYAYLILSGFLSAALYIALHELGHGIVALLCGGRIDDFNLWFGYVSTSGVRFNGVTAPLFYMAGALFPSFCAAVSMLLYRRGRRSCFYRAFSTLFAAVCIFALGDWICTPLLWLLDCAPKGDDCTVFLRIVSDAPLWAVSGAALLLAAGLTVLLFLRGLAEDFMDMIVNRGEPQKADERTDGRDPHE